MTAIIGKNTVGQCHLLMKFTIIQMKQLGQLMNNIIFHNADHRFSSYRQTQTDDRENLMVKKPKERGNTGIIKLRGA